MPAHYMLSLSNITSSLIFLIECNLLSEVLLASPLKDYKKNLLDVLLGKLKILALSAQDTNDVRYLLNIKVFTSPLTYGITAYV